MPLRLLHLSDIHFGIEDASALAAASAYSKASPFDLMVITGDVTQYARRTEFAAASAWLADLPGPRLVTPGNHDTPWMGIAERIVAPFHRFERAVGPSGPESFEAPGLVVHALNSARGWQIRLNWSKGAVSTRQARFAAGALSRTPEDTIRAVACHHPLIEIPGGPMTSRVRGGERAAERLVYAGTDIVLTGHLHAPFVQALPFGDGRTYAVGASTLSLRERGAAPGFNVIEIDGRDLAVSALGWTGGALEVQHKWQVQLRPRSAGLAARAAGH
jgi:3',5'-cyclic AMP phosphodiesterase CpdA